jgi:hypothetical protein
MKRRENPLAKCPLAPITEETDDRGIPLDVVADLEERAEQRKIDEDEAAFEWAIDHPGQEY